jgi:very-short-patch-repair endonuclease
MPAVEEAVARRRRLRRDATDAEAALWRLLRARELAGFKFRRQHSIGAYIVDFHCPRSRLIVELDGGQHYTPEAQSYDERRTSFFAQLGLRVLRFPNDVVLWEPAAVLEAIWAALTGELRPGPIPVRSPRPPGPVPSPRPRGEG